MGRLGAARSKSGGGAGRRRCRPAGVPGRPRERRRGGRWAVQGMGSPIGRFVEFEAPSGGDRRVNSTKRPIGGPILGAGRAPLELQAAEAYAAEFGGDVCVVGVEGDQELELGGAGYGRINAGEHDALGFDARGLAAFVE
jgi:hypothetical protein